MNSYRRSAAHEIRKEAAQLAFDRDHPQHKNNGDESRYSQAQYAMSFTKGLEHNSDTGLIEHKSDFEDFRSAIDLGRVEAFTSSVPVDKQKKRQWEAPTAGTVFSLQGPDAQSVTMAPAPALGSKELAYEMAEVYELAILRDIPFTNFETGASGSDADKVTKSIQNLDTIDYQIDGSDGRPRTNDAGSLSRQTVFRGSSPGVDVGPYLSQFLLLGNNDLAGRYDLKSGLIQYGALEINQRVPVAKPGVDYMTQWADWLEVQNGANTQDNPALFDASLPRRFMKTPRDLATYVHYDALYEAYLNACLILLGMNAPLDPGFDKLSGQGRHFFNSLSNSDFRSFEYHSREAGGFALWGGPHILTLVTEVATRALKAVRYQKFNVHCRLRPEVLAGRIARSEHIEKKFPCVGEKFSDLKSLMSETFGDLGAISPEGLLPMAFQEGSPMHPAYGAGHATVAGACVTILKAFFDTSSVLIKRPSDSGCFDYKFDAQQACDEAVQFRVDCDKDVLYPEKADDCLTLEGELNKLAANISIGRNMAGVHYYSDYYDSLRMGEQIAIGILEEQALCYSKDPFVLSIPTFDGDVVRIGAC
tara:strand:+ start:2754 stop:4520 length:1767 start_codon:yes stop_codon:yes gene_type:complete